MFPIPSSQLASHDRRVRPSVAVVGRILTRLASLCPASFLSLLRQVTLENLAELTGATVDENELKQQITEDDVRAALLSTEGGGVSYELVSGRNHDIVTVAPRAADVGCRELGNTLALTGCLGQSQGGRCLSSADYVIFRPSGKTHRLKK